jgi:hypothetical protein
MKQPEFIVFINELREKGKKPLTAGLSDGKGCHMLVTVTPKQQELLYMTSHSTITIGLNIDPEQLIIDEFQPIEFNSAGLKFKVFNSQIFWDGPITPRWVRLTLEP